MHPSSLLSICGHVVPQELCRYSADVNYAASQPLGSFKLRTALHMAAAGQCADIVRVLHPDPIIAASAGFVSHRSVLKAALIQLIL